ncbi:hypothetical protein KKF34_02730 [Myxococcota bacterium]|nr:hypothetical protein [Myxococcota bacterium]MBU1382291.1 hypothetical protein [Myxococcota bacterium]MBU1495777.1 hypothetical protein [Myxococcota bacterium]
MKNLFKIATLVLVLLTTSAVYAKRPGRRGMDGPPRMGMMGRMHHGHMGKGMMNHGKQGKHGGDIISKLIMHREALKLSEAQVLNLMRIKLKFAPKFVEAEKKVVIQKFDLRKEMLEENPNITKIERIMKAKMAAKAEKHILRIKMRLEVEKLLDPVQKTKLRFWMLKMKGGKARK